MYGLRGARARADDCSVVERVVGDDDRPLERTAEVLRLDEAAVRVTDAGAEAKRVGTAAIGGRRNREREVGHQLAPVDAAHAAKADEPVVRQDRRRGDPVVDGVD